MRRSLPPIPRPRRVLRHLVLATLLGAAAWAVSPVSTAGEEASQAPATGSEGAQEVGEIPPPALERTRQLERLLAVYRRIPGLRDIRIEVDGPVLELRGTALTAQDREQALALARELLPDLVYVDARDLHVETQLQRRLEPALERIREKAVQFIRFLPSLTLGLLILAGGALTAGWVGSREGAFSRVASNAFARNLLRQGLRAVILLVALLLALDLMGVTALVGAVLGAAGVAGIAIGFAFRDIVENYLAGVLLSLRHPFAPRDHVILAGEEGRVVRLTGRETVLMTLDGNHVRIPNATVFKAVITNLTRNPRRRFVFTVGVAPWEALDRVVEVMEAALRRVPGVLDSPPPGVRVQELGDSSVSLRASGWVDQTTTDFGKARSLALRAVKEALEAAGIDTPPPEFGIRILEAGGEAPGGGAPPPPSTTRKEPPMKPPSDAPSPLPDLSPDTAIDEEIEREARESPEENLLDPGRPPGDRRGG